MYPCQTYFSYECMWQTINGVAGLHQQRKKKTKLLRYGQHFQGTILREENMECLESVAG